MLWDIIHPNGHLVFSFPAADCWIRPGAFAIVLAFLCCGDAMIPIFSGIPVIDG